MIEIQQYKELEEYIKAFNDKKLNLLIVVSKGGLGKTMLTEDALLYEAPLVFNGHVTPMGMYKELYNRNEEDKEFMCVFDDVDSLMLNKTNVALLKQLCDTREEKTIKYFTTSPNIGDIPSEFTTRCKVLMLMNDLKTEDKNLNALLTRAHLVSFIPPDVEIISHIEKFGDDTEIINFIKTYTPFSKNLNLRVYKKAEELKNAKLNWKKETISQLKVDNRLFEIDNLLHKYDKDEIREKKFSESRSQYYRFKKLFLSKNKNIKQTI